MGCLTLIVFLLTCGCYCHVSLPRGAVGWSAIVAFPDYTHFFRALYSVSIISLMKREMVD